SMSAKLMPCGNTPSARKGGAFLVVHLPVAAVDEGQGRRLRIGGEKQVEPFTRAVAVGEVEMPGALAPHSGAARRPAGDDRIALGYGGGVVVGGVECNRLL